MKLYKQILNCLDFMADFWYTSFYLDMHTPLRIII